MAPAEEGTDSTGCTRSAGRRGFRARRGPAPSRDRFGALDARDRRIISSASSDGLTQSQIATRSASRRCMSRDSSGVLSRRCAKSSIEERDGTTADSSTPFAWFPPSRIPVALPARPLGDCSLARVDDETLADLKLAVTEACSNAIRHAYDEDAEGTVELAIDVQGGLLTIEVVDEGRGFDLRASAAARVRGRGSRRRHGARDHPRARGRARARADGRAR